MESLSKHEWRQGTACWRRLSCGVDSGHEAWGDARRVLLGRASWHKKVQPQSRTGSLCAMSNPNLCSAHLRIAGCLMEISPMRYAGSDPWCFSYNLRPSISFFLNEIVFNKPQEPILNRHWDRIRGSCSIELGADTFWDVLRWGGQNFIYRCMPFSLCISLSQALICQSHSKTYGWSFLENTTPRVYAYSL